MHFTKMHGLGNDYLYVYGEPVDPENLSIQLSERHFGAGSDGMIWISPSSIADFKMRIFNADGSEAMMCGNGIRCVGKYVYDKGYTHKKKINIETNSGIKQLILHTKNKQVDSATVDMGIGEVLEENLKVHGYTGTFASMGNPHFVTFVENVEDIDLTKVGPKIEWDKHFENRTNVEFVQVLDDHTLRMRVWERGSGITMACGTGACATVLSAVNLGICPRDTQVEVKLDGGSLFIEIDTNNRVYMTGPATTVYEGETV